MSAEDENFPEEEDFAQMLEASFEPETFSEGQTVEGRVVQVGREVAFVDIGGKGEASIDLEELVDDEGDVDVEVGDIVQAVVVSTRGGLKLSHKLARGAANREQLEEAYRSGLPVEARVEKAIKGGYEIRVGGQRGFCPISQIDTNFTDDPEVHVGQTYTFRITELQNKNLVVSRKQILQEAERERAAEVRAQIVPGADLEGRVVSVRDYGAFIDLGGGIQGLLHVSEMGWSRVTDPKSIVEPGDEITVKVLSIDEEKDRIALGLKQLLADPWDSAEDTYEPGQVLMGKVTRIADFGAFIELEPGIEALAHASNFPPTGKRDAWRGKVPVGESVPVELLTVDFEKKRIGVAVVEEGSVRAKGAYSQDAPKDPITVGEKITGKVERHESFGFFVFLAPGKTGLVPFSESGEEKNVDLRKKFPVGDDIEVIITDIQEGGRRIRLSRKAVFEAEERRDAEQYREKEESQHAASFGSLADKLKAAMKKPKG